MKKTLIIPLMSLLLSSCSNSYVSANQLKTSFLKVYEKEEIKGDNYFQEGNPEQFLVVLGKYGDGYLLSDKIIYAYNEVQTIKIEGVSITVTKGVDFFYFIDKKIYCGLPEIYLLGYLSKEDLIDVKNKFDEAANNSKHHYYVVEDDHFN